MALVRRQWSPVHDRAVKYGLPLWHLQRTQRGPAGRRAEPGRAERAAGPDRCRGLSGPLMPLIIWPATPPVPPGAKPCRRRTSYMIANRAAPAADSWRSRITNSRGADPPSAEPSAPLIPLQGHRTRSPAQSSQCRLYGGRNTADLLAGHCPVNKVKHFGLITNFLATITIKHNIA